MNRIRIEAPLRDEIVSQLRAGDRVLLSGPVYTARDAAHKILTDLIAKGKPLPFPIRGAVIYYTGPSPAPPGKIIGSAGPTTSYRMDTFTPMLLKAGLKATIGKGPRSDEVREAMKRYRAIYLGATGGAAALISRSIVEAEVIAFGELGTEAIRRLTVREMPLVVIDDCYGNDLYAIAREKRIQ